MPQVAFGLARDLTTRTQDKGGQMFARLRARAAAEETDETGDEAAQAGRGDVMRRIANSYVPQTPAAPRQDVVDSGVEQPGSATRLLEMIEKSRSTSLGPTAAHPASG